MFDATLFYFKYSTIILFVLYFIICIVYFICFTCVGHHGRSGVYLNGLPFYILCMYSVFYIINIIIIIIIIICRALSSPSRLPPAK